MGPILKWRELNFENNFQTRINKFAFHKIYFSITVLSN
jgi:hypothetical protein